MADHEEGVPTPNLPQAQPQPPTTRSTTTSSSTFKLVKFQTRIFRKPDEDAEAHLLHSNDWMKVHHFVEGVKVQRFCLTLLREARLWYQSLEPINVDWQKKILDKQQKQQKEYWQKKIRQTINWTNLWQPIYEHQGKTKQ